MLLVVFFSISQLSSPKIAGGDFPPREPVAPGDPAKYVQIEAVDEGFDVFHPVHFERYTGVS